MFILYCIQNPCILNASILLKLPSELEPLSLLSLTALVISTRKMNEVKNEMFQIIIVYNNVTNIRIHVY